MTDAEDRGREERVIFALDIGTRSVTGVVGEIENGMLRVLGVETQEHAERAVVDGQIEDIEQTARVARLVKQRLEQRLGFTLSEVYVAAAGRVLKTKRVACALELDEKKPVSQEELFKLESKAIQQAYQALLEELGGDGGVTYYCVGHSVIQYTLDGYAFSTLVNHRGRQAAVELIATFLPSEVVESLYGAMQQTELTIMSITLEPIAAISAVIPQELRLLNIALVDVGAGTSDIAITNNGSVCAYTMATMAGDEITERVMREFLVDFQMAEKMKFMLSEGKELIAYCDILGFEYSIPSEELRQRILPAVEELAQTIAQQILEINGAPPMAVFMVGGGSRTPELCRLVAQNLSIDEKKVAIGGNNYMKRMVETEPQYISAEYATPIGIAISAMSAQGQENLSVVINGQRVRMMRMGAMTLLEALLRAGYQYGQIMGRSGRSVTYALDGEKKVARGGVPTLAEFEVNGRAANITTPLEAGDSVRFTPAVNGADARPLARGAVKDFAPLEIEYNGETVRAGVYVTINGTPAEAEDEIHEADKVHVLRIITLGDLLVQTDGSLEATVVNGARRTADYILKEGDRVSTVAGAGAAEPPPVSPNSMVVQPAASAAYEPAPMQQPFQPSAPPLSAPAQASETCETPRAAVPNQPVKPVLHVVSHAEEKPQPPEPAVPQRHGAVQIILNGSPVLLPAKPDGTPNLFFDVLNYVAIDPDHPQGEPVIRRNDRAASYIEPIHDGDRIEVYWG